MRNMSKNNQKQFVLHSDFKPAGDQPQAIERLVEGLADGLAHQTLLGVTGSGKTFTVASVIERVQRPTLILAPNKTLAAQLYGEFREFFPENAVEYFVSYYDYYQPEAYVPASDTYIEKDASINEHIEQMRLSATKALLERKDAIIVATVSSIYGLGDPEAYFSMVLHLFRGDRVDQRSILRRLAELQYQRNELDFSQGTYRVRGDVIDVFPAESDRDAVRIELFDDEIESLSYFDPLTGEVRKTVTAERLVTAGHHIRCYPGKATSRYLLLNKRGVEFFDLEGTNHMRANWTRGACGFGMLPANGFLYTPPAQCFCYQGVLLTGLNALAASRETRNLTSATPAPEPRVERGPAFGAVSDQRSAFSY